MDTSEKTLRERIKTLRNIGGFFKFCCFHYQVLIAIFSFSAMENVACETKKASKGRFENTTSTVLYPDGDAGVRGTIKYDEPLVWEPGQL